MNFISVFVLNSCGIAVSEWLHLTIKNDEKGTTKAHLNVVDACVVKNVPDLFKQMSMHVHFE